MRLFILEIKRVLKTPMTIIMLVAALLLSFALAYIPVTFEYVAKEYDGDRPVYATGLEAIRLNREKLLEGEITQDKISHAISTYQQVLKDNHVEETYELPVKTYNDNFGTIYHLFTPIANAYADKRGEACNIRDIDMAHLGDFYDGADRYFEAKLRKTEGAYPAALEKARAMRSQVTKPYVFYYGASSNVLDYETVTLLIILLCCTVAVAPVFSAEYQSGGDSILRCTKYGRTRLALIKIASALSIAIGSAILCLLTWIGGTFAFFGTQGMETSLQMVLSIACMLSMNVGQWIWTHGGLGLLILTTSLCFTLFVSARSKNNVQAMSISLLACFAPMIIYWVLPEEMARVVKCFLPSGGIGLNNSIYFDITGISFCHIGSLAIWTPYAMIAISVVELVLFTVLCIRSYNRHV